MLPGKTYTADDIWAIVLRRLWLLPLPFITLFGALIVSSFLPDVYQSAMLIAIVPQRVPNEFVRSTVTLRTEERLDAITVQIKSRSVLEPMINEFNLYPEERTKLPFEDVVVKMRNSIDVQLEAPRRPVAGREQDPTAFQVRFTYPDATIAARVTQRLGSTFVDQNTRDRGALASATDDFLQLQLAESRTRLEAQEKRVEAFRQRHGNQLPTQLQTNLTAMQNTQMQIQAQVEAIARDRDRKLMLERLYEQAQNEPAPAMAAPVVAAPSESALPDRPPVSASPQEKLAYERALLATLETRLTPQHPDILRTKKRIAELEPQVAAAEAAARAASADGGPAAAATTPDETRRRERLAQYRAEIESLDRQTEFKESDVQRLRTVLGDYQRRIEAVPGVESEWSVLTRDYDTMQKAYNDLLAKSGASKVALDLENRQIGENFRVLDAARVSEKPVSPNRIRITAIGIALGFALAIGIALLLEIKDSSFRSEEDIQNLLSVTVLALVPYMETASERRGRIWRWVAVSAGAVVAVAGAGYAFWVMRLWTVIV